MHGKSTVVALAGRLWLAGWLSTAGAALAGTFGQVVPVGGHANDVALDEARGRLYIANFTARRIDVMSLATRTITTSMNVTEQPHSLSLSPNGRWLIATHYINKDTPGVVTLIDLANNNARQTFSLANAPLGAAFGIDNRALIVTSKDFLLFEPTLGTTQVLSTISGVTGDTGGQVIPAPVQSAPAEITEASVGASADGRFVWGFGDSLMFRYEVATRSIRATRYSSSPTLGPRSVAVSNDGQQAALGWWMADFNPRWQYLRLYGLFEEPLGNLAKGGHAIDSARGLVYAQVPRTEDEAPVLTVRDLDNLTLRERLQLPEHLAGRAVLSANGNTMYAVSDSGVLVLPVGQLNSVPRLAASVEDLLFLGNFCDRDSVSQSFTLSDPGGARVPFSISSGNSGVRVTPSSGLTPAVVKVTVDAAVFASEQGTAAVELSITSQTAVNLLKPVRVLINSREPDQRGTIVNNPGKLVDLVADPAKDQYYVLRQDQNQVRVFDGANNTVKATLRTCNMPAGMAITNDRRYLLVGCARAQIVSVFDLEILQAVEPIHTPNASVYSLAGSTRGVLAVAFDHSQGDYGIFRLDLSSRLGTRLPRLGVWENKVPQNTVSTASGNGATILFPSPDGSLLLYNANVDTFTVSRKDFTAFRGGYAGSAFDEYIVGGQVLNSSGVPVRLLQTAGTPAGFAFTDQDGFLVSAPAQSSPGVIARVHTATGLIRPTRTAEAPILPTDAEPFTRTVAPLYSRGTIIMLTVSGVTVLPSGYDASIAAPNLSRAVSAADGVSPVAPGGLFTIFGTNLSPTNVATKEIPLPTALGDSCITVNGQPVPVIFVSPNQINAQMPYQTVGNVTMVVHTPGGVSDNYNLTVQSNAPAVFRAEVAPGQAFPTVVRSANNLMATDTNPVHRDDTLVIYLTGLGRVTPFVENGRPAPSDPLATTVTESEVTIGGVAAPVLYSGLAPGQVGLYQLNVRVPWNTPKGLGIPLTIVQGTFSHTVNVRVVD